MCLRLEGNESTKPHRLVQAIGLGCFRVSQSWQVAKMFLARVTPLEEAAEEPLLPEELDRVVQLREEFTNLGEELAMVNAFPGLKEHLARQLARGMPAGPRESTWFMAHTLPFQELRYAMLQRGLLGVSERIRMLTEALDSMHQQVSMAGVPAAGHDAD